MQHKKATWSIVTKVTFPYIIYAYSIGPINILPNYFDERIFLVRPTFARSSMTLQLPNFT